ncbi:MAG: mobile mystery protein B [Opitutae bacterium]|nr:mobile mystery protein B [Opitutae bacterium]
MTSDLFETQPGDTPLTPEEQLDLVPSIATRAELNALERYNINDARLWAMRPRVLRREDLLTDHFARELHRRMFSEVWRWAGKYRTTEKTLGWDWPRITEGMRTAFEDAAYWDKNGTYPLLEAAARLHHRLVVIHPWSNGNGRHARLIADVWCAARKVAEPTWGAHADLLAPGETRQRYLAAMRRADAGDFGPIVAFAQS